MMSNSPDAAFNLVDDPWLPCLLDDGTVVDLSIRDVFADSPTIRSIMTDQPTESYAIFRVLLVIFWRSWLTGPHGADDPEEWWDQLWDAGEFGETGLHVTDYLNSHHHRFELFDSTTPFMQVPDLHTRKNEFKLPVQIMNDCESEYLTMAAGPGLTRLPFAEAARRLITTQAWDYSGIKSGAVDDSRVKGGRGYPIGTGWAGETGGVTLHGDSIFEDFLLNTPAQWVQSVSDAKRDLPVWERIPPTPEQRDFGQEALTPDGPCDQLTWQSRRIRLLSDSDAVNAVLVCNGDKINTKNQFADPMTGFRYSKNQSNRSTVVYMPQRHQASRTLWKGIAPLLAKSGRHSSDQDHPSRIPTTIDHLHGLDISDHKMIGVELTGIEYGTQNSSISAVIHERLDVDSEVLSAETPTLADLIIEVAKETMDAAIDFGRFHGMVLQAAGGSYEFRAEAADTLLSDLNEPFKLWIQTLHSGVDREERRSQWNQAARSYIENRASRLAETAGPKALVGLLRPGSHGRSVVSSAGTAYGTLQRRLKLRLPTIDDRPHADEAALQEEAL